MPLYYIFSQSLPIYRNLSIAATKKKVRKSIFILTKGADTQILRRSEEGRVQLCIIAYEMTI